MKFHSTFALSLFISCLLPALGAAQEYTIKDLGAFIPSAINTWGQVVGIHNNQAAIWTVSSGTHSLGILPGGTASSAAHQ